MGSSLEIYQIYNKMAIVIFQYIVLYNECNLVSKLHFYSIFLNCGASAQVDKSKMTKPQI